MRIEGRAALAYPGFRDLVLASGKRRLLVMWGATALMAVGALLISVPAGVVLLVGAAVVLPLTFDLSLRRTWRRLARGAAAAVTPEGWDSALGGHVP